MDRPLWQIVLALLFGALAVQRAAAGLALHDAGLGAAAVALYAVQTALALATAAALWLGRRWASQALVALGAALVLSALVEGLVLGVRAPLDAVGEIAVVALSLGALAYALRREQEAPESGRLAETRR